MIGNLELKTKLQNLQKLIRHTLPLNNLCTNSSKEKYTDILVDEIQSIIEHINSLNEEVKKGSITKEMASIDTNYWIDDNNWKDAKTLYDSTNYPEGSSAHEKLRDALTRLQKGLASLRKIILNAPAKCYQNFYESCRDKTGEDLAETHFIGFQASCHMYKEDLLRSMQHYKQYVIYEFFKRNFLRYDHCPLFNPHGRKFNFDFDLLPNEAEDNEKTRNFCLCLNRYLIIPDNNTIYLNKELLGKYLFDNYPNITDFDRIGVYYLEKAFEQYNQGMKEVRSQAAEQNDETETNILKQPAAMVLWEKLQKAGYVNEDLKPTGKASNAHLAIVAVELCAHLNIKFKWRWFEELWGVKNMRMYNNRAMEQGNSMVFRQKIRELLAA